MTLELHRLIREDQGDSEEAEALPDRMYDFLQQSSAEKILQAALPACERERQGGGEDLYSPLISLDGP